MVETRRGSAPSLDEATTQRARWKFGYRYERGFVEVESDSFWAALRVFLLGIRRAR